MPSQQEEIERITEKFRDDSCKAADYLWECQQKSLYEIITSLTEAHKVEMEKILVAYQMSLEAGNVADVITDIKNRIIINKV